MTDEQVKEYTRRISQANASGLVEIIYELLLDTLQEAVNAKENGEEYLCLEYIKKAQRYVEELIHGLNLQEPIAGQIAKRYIFLHKQLLQAARTPDTEILKEVKKEIEYMQPHFIRIAGEDKDEPLMQHTQKVYAGLTYGRKSLNEMSIDPCNNRGYQV